MSAATADEGVGGMGGWGGRGEEMGRSLLSFLKIKESILIFQKICPDCVVRLLLKFLIKSVVLRVSRRKKLPNFSGWRFFDVL